jgi:16S rRNA (cytidine1402-2'-O)-methyltransferase
MPGTLFVVGTPLGNLEDITQRALRILREVDLIAAEDTRVTGKLLAHFAISTPTVSFHQYSGPSRLSHLLAHLAAGHSLALVTDAGMPGISDPGQPLIQACRDAGIPIVPVPGPSAVTTALAVSGFPTDRFRFLGFLPRGGAERRALLRESLTGLETCVAFEAPHRVVDTLTDLATLVPTHPVLLARELTKKFEELRRAPVCELRDALRLTPPRGEIVLVWPGGVTLAPPTPPLDPWVDALGRAQRYRADGASTRDAASRAAAETGVARRTLYQALTQENERGDA